MMKKSSRIWVVFGVILGVTELQADGSPQEIFNELCATSQPVVMQPQKRAQSFPALAVLPAEADMVAAVAEPGEALLGLMDICGKEVDETMRAKLSSIRDAAIVMGKGSADALREAIPLMSHSSRLEMMRMCEKKWSAKARPEYVECIHTEFARQRERDRIGLLTALERFHPAPVYCALTAKDGREKDFAECHRVLLDALREAATRDCGIQYVEHGGYAGVRMSRLKAMELMRCRAPEEAEVQRVLSQQEIYLLTRNRGRAALVILCEEPGNIVLPPTAAFSMLYSPKLNGADAHMGSALATVWCSTAFNRTMRTLGDENSYSTAQAVVNSLRAIGAKNPQQQQIFNDAAEQLAWLYSRPSHLNVLKTPFTMQVWQQENEVYVETVSDAQGMKFEPGELRLADQAEARETIFYMESTAFNVPHTTPYADHWDRMSQALLQVGEGIVLSLQDAERGSVDAYLRYARLFRNEIEAVGKAIHTIGSGMAAPFAVLLCHPADAGASSATGSSWAFGAAVKNRKVLSEGWQQLVDAVGSAAGKVGVPPMLLQALPIEKQELGNAAVSYALALPFAQAESLPRIAVNNQYFVLGNAGSLNAHMLSSASEKMPYCGAVNSIHFPRLAQAVRLGHLPIAEAIGASREKVEGVCERLAERVNKLYSVSTISDDVRTARALMILSKPSEQQGQTH